MTTTATTSDETFDLTEDAEGKLALRRDGHDDAADVRIRRAFPWSNPSKYISIRSSEGKELVLVRDLAALPEAQRRLIERHLESGVFIPRITRVENVDVRFGYQQWTVQTDCGPAAFRVQEREDLRFLGDGRFSIKDADGNVYVLPPLEQLDEQSRLAVEPLL